MNTIEIKTEMWDNVLARLIDDDNVDGFCTTCDCWVDISRFQTENGYCQPCKDCYVDEEWEAGFEDEEDNQTNEELMTQIVINNKRIGELKEQNDRKDCEINRIAFK